MIKEKFSVEEYANWGMREAFEEAWIAEENGEYSILREVFISEGNTGWTYEALVSGFETEQKAEEYLQNIYK